MKEIKENIKKIISLILITVILSTATPWYVFAQEINGSNTTQTDEKIKQKVK